MPRPPCRCSRLPALLLALLLMTAAARADAPNLQPKGYINDFAGVLSPSAAARGEALAAEVERKTGAQIAVVVIRSLDGQPIEDYANTLARRWGIGRKDNRGLLLLFAIQDRRDRFEVGYGLEPILPDGRVGGILRTLRPYLQQGNYDAAVLYALDQASSVVAQASGVTLDGRIYQRPPPGQARRPDIPLWWLLLGLIGLILLLRAGFGLPFFLPINFGGGGRGGGWGGGGGGGGFGGFGGGDFGGGGASSDW